jgi:DNA-binding winged helix-turn-helix (wHTH) protein/TolB-like protein/tetratricopeptide (TPR) repeat protein
MADDPSICLFGAFELDLACHQLRRKGRAVRLQPRAFKVLTLLAAKAPHLVTRETLRRELWRDHTFVGFDQGINASIKQIRAALRDDANNPRYIETVPRIGYRFIADASWPDAARPVPPVDDVLPAVRRAYSRASLGAAALVVAVGGVGLGVWFSWYRQAPEAFAPRMKVVQFESLDGNPESARIAQALTDGVVARLAASADVELVAGADGQTSTRSSRAPHSTVKGIVEGSVLVSDEQVRVSARLLDAPTSHVLWTEIYDVERTDALGVQADVTPAIVAAVRLTLGDRSSPSGSTEPVSVEVHRAYLRGRYHWGRRTPEDLAASLRYFRQSVEQDPTYARGYAGLAESHIVLGDYASAHAAALKALEFNGSLAEARAAFARTMLPMNGWNWLAVEAEFTRAIHLDPTYATARQWYAHYLGARGRHDEAIAHLRMAEALEPFSFTVKENIGWQLYLARRYDEALKCLRGTLNVIPDFVPALETAGLALTQKGNYEEAIATLKRAVRLTGSKSVSAALLSYAYSRSGRASNARMVVQELHGGRELHPDTVLIGAVVHYRLGDKERAFEWLNTAYEDRNGGLAWLNVDPAFDDMRAEPQFKELVSRVGLSERGQ